MIKVSDDRLGPEVNLAKLQPGDTFIWNEYPCIRMNITEKDWQCKDEHLPCMLLASGQYIEIGRLAGVTPIKCELTITE